MIHAIVIAKHNSHNNNCPTTHHRHVVLLSVRQVYKFPVFDSANFSVSMENLYERCLSPFQKVCGEGMDGSSIPLGSRVDWCRADSRPTGYRDDQSFAENKQMTVNNISVEPMLMNLIAAEFTE